MSDLYNAVKNQRLEREAAEAKTAAAADAREKKQTAAEKERARVVAAWTRCKGGCQCKYGGTRGQTTKKKDHVCPYKDLIMCDVCGDLKKTVCRKAACTTPPAPGSITVATDPATDPGA